MAIRPNLLFIASSSAMPLLLTCSTAIGLGLVACAEERPSKTGQEGDRSIPRKRTLAPPYGYVDWWPVNLGFNNLEEPFRDVQIRHAINHAINREELVEVGWQRAGKANFLPFPNFPALRQYLDEAAPLVEKYGVATYDTARTAAIMRAKGWRRDEEGFWARDGTRFKIPIDIGTVHQDLAPVLVAQLRRAGFNASSRMTADSITRMAQGTAKAFMMGSVGSIRDPYFTLNFFHSRYVQPTGTHSEHYWRWRHVEVPPNSPQPDLLD